MQDPQALIQDLGAQIFVDFDLKFIGHFSFEATNKYVFFVYHNVSASFCCNYVDLCFQSEFLKKIEVVNRYKRHIKI